MSIAKRDLLAYLQRKVETDASEVASEFEIHFSVAAMRLLRLVRQGLASRDRSSARGVYRYRISERGQSRLKYLQEQTIEDRGNDTISRE